MNDTRLLTEVQAVKARLMQQQGNVLEAHRWASRRNHTLRLVPMPVFYPSPITLVQTLLDQNTSESLHKATQIVDGLKDSAQSIHCTRYLIMVLALKALLQEAYHDEARALSTLEEAVNLAQPGGVVRIFADMGPRMAGLLSRLQKQDGLSGHVTVILQAFQLQKPDLHNHGKFQLIEPLTDRELEILMLLAQRLSNKEIAQELFISPLTVKRHNINIYQKLNANNRREAVVVASHLGLVSVNHLVA